MFQRLKLYLYNIKRLETNFRYLDFDRDIIKEDPNEEAYKILHKNVRDEDLVGEPLDPLLKVYLH